MEEKRPLRVIVILEVSILAIAIGLFLCSFIGKQFPVHSTNAQYIKEMVPRVGVSVLLIVCMRIFYPRLRLGFCLKGMGQGLLLSIVMVIYIVENFVSGSKVDAVIDFSKITAWNYILCFFANMSVGLFEEVLLRGTVLNIMNEQWKCRKYGSYAAVGLSSLLFGLAHFVNYFNGSNYLNPTIAQVFYATFIGLFMASVYLKSGNMWLVILLHGLFDFAAEFWELVTPTTNISKVDISIANVEYLIVFYLPLAITAFFITRSYVTEYQQDQ
ncbi:MAG: CPBP family intramembrane metalloprotease [bacterium]|nr:CPBP family intramembrane metalloprotease [bacterium]